MLDSAEARSKPVEARHVAFYAVQALKSGRRACYGGRTDAMSPAAQLDGNAVLASLDATYAVASDDADVTESTMRDSLAAGFEDGATVAGRRLDWDLVLRRLDDRRRRVLVATAEGASHKRDSQELPGVVPPRRNCRGAIGRATVKPAGSKTTSPAMQCDADCCPTGSRREQQLSHQGSITKGNDMTANNIKIELRKVEYSPRLSQETPAFSAEVYLNGRKAGDVRNDGQGSPHYYQGDFGALHAYAAGLPQENVDLGDGHVISIQPDADLLVSKALDDWLDERDARSTPAGFEALLAAMGICRV